MSDPSSNPSAVAGGSPAPGGPVVVTPAAAATAKPEAPKEWWHPLTVPAFRALWIAYSISLIGTWAREAGGPKLMENLTAGRPDSPFWVSLIQTAGNLPIALLSIAAGVLADIFDRRKLLLWTSVWMLVWSALLATATLTGFINKEAVLVFTLLLGVGAAMAGPAFQYMIPELVPPKDMPLAVALNSVALNVARAVGPALAGGVIALVVYYQSSHLAPGQSLDLGSRLRATGTSFVLNAVAFVGVVWVLARWDRAPQKPPVHRETLWGATVTAFRYTAHSPALRAILVRVAAFILCAVIVWAQLIIIAKRQLATGATPELKNANGENIYYILMACVGAGAVAGVMFMPRMDKRFSTEGMVKLCTAVFGLALIGLSQCRGPLASIWLAAPLAIVIGFNWVIVPTNFNIATQKSVPNWVKGRAIAMYMTVLFGSFAVGSPIWGGLASSLQEAHNKSRIADVVAAGGDPKSVDTKDGFGISMAALTAGSLIILGLLLVKRFPLSRAVGQDFAPANRPAPPDLAGDDAKLAKSPLEAVIEYRVPAGRAEEFVRLMRRDVRLARRRNGATRWRLERRRAAAGEPEVQFRETFVFGSWADRLRHHARTTKADAATEDRALAQCADGTGARTTYRAAVEPPHVEVALKRWLLARLADPFSTKPAASEWVPAHPSHGTARGRLAFERDAFLDRLRTPWQKDRT
ncbi:MAG: MFS transporter [Phycisphaerae bacterium]|nr:MFS transporter [Tepidisphaeraceae bacterium]